MTQNDTMSTVIGFDHDVRSHNVTMQRRYCACHGFDLGTITGLEMHMLLMATVRWEAPTSH